MRLGSLKRETANLYEKSIQKTVQVILVILLTITPVSCDIDWEQEYSGRDDDIYIRAGSSRYGDIVYNID